MLVTLRYERFECKNQSNHLEGRKVSQRVHENSKYKQANCLTRRKMQLIKLRLVSALNLIG